MNLDISEHLAYNQYKEKLNEIFTKLDEVLYISNTIDYKKITILLAEIVQNFDYFKYHKEKLAEAAEAKDTGEIKENDAGEARMVVGGKRGRRKVKGGDVDDMQPEPEPEPETKETTEPTEPPPQKPYSRIDDDDKGFAESIKNIKEGEEYKKLVSYIDTTKERINNKGTKLMEKVKDFIKEYLQNPERNSMIDADYIKQHSNIEFKLNDIISNIDKIEDGIQKESTEYAKIYVDLMSNKWCSIKDAKYLRFITICADGWYYIKKTFVKNAHVIDKEVGIDITKDDYKDFVDNKLYKLYLELHKEFLKEPEDEKPSDTKTTPTEDFDTIIVLFKNEFESIKVKIEIAKEEEVEEANTDADAKTEIKEAIAKTAKEGEETKAIAKVEEKEAIAKVEEKEAIAETAKVVEEAKEAKTPTIKESKAKTVAEAKAAKVEEKEAKARVEAITGATKRKEAKAEADAIITEARIKSTEKARELAEKTKNEAEAKVAEITQQANDARELVLQSRANASSLLGNKNPFKGLTTSLQGLKEEVGTEAKQTTDVYANAMNAVGKYKIDKAKDKINKVNPLPP